MMTEERVAGLARRLRAWGLNGLAASLLESGGPLAFLGAQALYFVGPTLAPFAPEDEVTALARLLEDPASVQALAQRLEEDAP
jgi:hypothetical protein